SPTSRRSPTTCSTTSGSTAVSAVSASRRSARGTSATPARVRRVAREEPRPVDVVIASDQRQEPLQLVRGHLRTVLGPLLPLVAQEVVEDMLAGRLGGELGALQDLDGRLERRRQGLDAQSLA